MQIKNARNSGILIAALTSAFALSACGASNTPAQPAQVVSQPNDSAPASGQAPATTSGGTSSGSTSSNDNSGDSTHTIVVIHDNGVDRRGYYDGPDRHFIEVGPDNHPFGPDNRPGFGRGPDQRNDEQRHDDQRHDEHPAGVSNPAQPAAPAQPAPAAPAAPAAPVQKPEPAKPAAPTTSDAHPDAPAKSGSAHEAHPDAHDKS